MECPECGGETKVIESVPYPDRVRRRRECDVCGARFTTGEWPLLEWARLTHKKINEATELIVSAIGAADGLGVDQLHEDLTEAATALRKARDRIERREEEA